MKVVVTGSHGFVGKNLVKFLKTKGNEVVELDINSPSQNDLNTSWVVDYCVKDADAIIHLAAYADVLVGEKFKNDLFTNNVNVTSNVLCAAEKYDRRLITISSAAVYGNYTIPRSTTDRLEPSNSYGISKLLSEQQVKHFERLYNTRTTIFRPFNIYGPHNENGVIGKFIEAVLFDQRLILTGEGRQCRDFVYVDDICNALYNVISDPGSIGKIYNLGTGIATSVYDVAKKIIGLTGVSTEIEFSSAPTGVSYSCADLIEIVANQPKYTRCTTSLDEGLEKTIQWHRMIGK
jgi:UDP-glucose 4-epimerase